MEVHPDRIQKLDDPIKFKMIKTNLTNKKDLPLNTQNAYGRWFRLLKSKNIIENDNINDIGWVEDHTADIVKLVMTTPTITKDNTKRNHLENLARVLLAINKRKHKESARKLFIVGIKLSKKIKHDERDNIMKTHELKNYVSYRDIEDLRFKLFRVWEEEPENTVSNIDNLILSLNTLIPPLRLNFIKTSTVGGAKFWIESTEPPIDNFNYLWEKIPNEWWVVLNRDKNSEFEKGQKGYNRVIFEIGKKLPGMARRGELLNKIITASYKLYPRTWVLPSYRDDNIPLSTTGYNSVLSILFSPKKPTQNIFRKAFINKFYNMKMSENKLNELATRMRHKSSIARDAYKKINI